MRLLWGMTQVINAIHRFYRDKLLVDDIGAKSALEEIHIGKKSMRIVQKAVSKTATTLGKPTPTTVALAVADVAQFTVREIIKVDNPARNKKFKEWLDILKKFQEAGTKPELNSITIDVFGFSRGAAEARAFTNWMIEAFQFAAGTEGFEVKLGKIPVRFRFMGIFDTVASVGVAGLYSFSEGHMAWADNCLEIPGQVKQCLHLVAGHEVRACFPLDSVRVEGQYPSNVEEIVYPGSHSDLGGGYVLRSFGKDDLGKNRTDLQISRVPCFHMYLKARDKGVPFYSIQELRELNPSLLESFLPSLETIERMAKYEKLIGASGPVEDVLRKHTGVYLGCRWLMGEEYLLSPDFVRLGINAKGIEEIKNKREKALEKFNEQIKIKKKEFDRNEMIRRLGYVKRSPDYQDPIVEELNALNKAQIFLEEQVNKSKDAKVMWQTQEALFSVLSVYCREIAQKTDQAKKHPALRSTNFQSDGGLSHLYSGHLRDFTIVGDEGKRNLVIQELKRGIKSCENELCKNEEVNQTLVLRFSVARAAVECLKLWREHLAAWIIPEEHDESAPEREPIWLLEALQDIENRSPEFIKSAIDFFADQVHDSMAGFIKDAFHEYDYNFFGIAKFRRVYFGDRGDACLREKVHAENVQRKAAARQNKANNHAMLEEQQANEKVLQWQVGNTMGDLGNMRW